MTRSIHTLMLLCVAVWAHAQNDERSVTIDMTTDTVQVGDAFTITWTVKGAVDQAEVITTPGMPAVSKPGIRSSRKWLNGIRTDEATYTVRVMALQAGVQVAPMLKVIWEDDERPNMYSSGEIVVEGTPPASEEQMIFHLSPQRPEGTRIVQYHDGKGFVTERRDGMDELVRYLDPKEIKRLEKLIR